MAQDRNEQIRGAHKIIGERFASITFDGLYADDYKRPVVSFHIF